MTKFLTYFIIILWAFHTIKFIFELVSEKIRNSEEIFYRSFYAIIFSIIFLAFTYDQINKNLEFLNHYTIIPLYFNIHLILTFILYLILMVVPFLLIFLESILKVVRYLILFFIDLIKWLLEIIKYISGLKTIIKFFNKFIYPIIYKAYTFTQNKLGPYNEITFKNINWIKFAKNLFIISYLIAGLIVLSPLNNKISTEMLEEHYKSNQYDIFKNDYDLYKEVFVITLIPFSLSYVFKKESNNKNLYENINNIDDK